MLLKKSLGQHLLTDGRVLGRIVAAAKVVPGEVCLEIGPGTGNLTRRLLAAGARVTALELDDRFAAALEKFAASGAGAGELTVVHGDVLALDLRALVSKAAGGGPVKVVANLPYNIASAVTIRLLELKGLVGGMFVLVQKEVADRIAAPAGDSARGSLSVFCQARARCVPRFTVPPSAFKPPPAVQSRLLEIEPYGEDGFGIADGAVFERIVEGAFEHRRKTCYNSLRFSFEKGACKGLIPGRISINEFTDGLFEQAGISVTARAQELEIGEFAALSNITSKLSADAGADK